VKRKIQPFAAVSKPSWSDELVH